MEELETYKLKSPVKRLSARLYSKAVVHLPQGVQYPHSQLLEWCPQAAAFEI